MSPIDQTMGIWAASARRFATKDATWPMLLFLRSLAVEPEEEQSLHGVVKEVLDTCM